MIYLPEKKIESNIFPQFMTILGSSNTGKIIIGLTSIIIRNFKLPSLGKSFNHPIYWLGLGDVKTVNSFFPKNF